MRRLQFKFLSQIRISGWDFGSSARAMNQAGGFISTQADLEKVSRSTTERKSMSTKTSIKRVALVAVSALGLGVLSSVAPASAATYPTIAATSGTNSTGGTALTAPTATATVNNYVVDTMTVGTADKVYTITSTGVGSLAIVAQASDATATSTGGAVTTADASGMNYVVNSTTSITLYSGDTHSTATPGAGSAFAGTGVLQFSATSATAGAQTITITGNSGTSATQVITWGAAPVASVNTSTVYTTDATAALSNTVATAQAVTGVSSNTTLLLSKTATGSTAAAAIVVTLKDNSSASGAALASKAVTATVTGAGLVDGYTSTGSTFNATPSKSATAYTDSNGVAVFHISGDGTSGTGSIAVTYTSTATGTLTLSTKTVTFYSSTVAKLEATQGLVVAAAGQTLGDSDGAGDGAFIVSATDSAGNPIHGLSAGTSVSLGFFVTSDNTACITSTIGTVTEGTSAAGYLPVGTYDINLSAAANAVSGCSANVTVSYYNSATSTIVAAGTMKYSVGGTKIYGVKMSLPQDTYAPGEKVTYTLTATDISGNPVADGYYGVFNSGAWNVATTQTAVAGLSMTASTPSTPFAKAAVTSGTTNLFLIGGKATSSTYAPYISGKVTGTAYTSATSGALAAAVQYVPLSASFTVALPSDSAQQDAIDAANEATDAANAATDAANAAAEAADAATAAAQDAQAAVAALASQVADLIEGIKAQITALTNLVVKIQKKVKA